MINTEPLDSQKNGSALWRWIRRHERMLLILLVGSILFDVMVSWLVIDVWHLVPELNPLINSVADVVGFGGAMILRALTGVALAFVIYWLSARYGERNHRASYGLLVATVALTSLSVYHLVGLVYLYMRVS